jgi:hypothetical protein
MSNINEILKPVGKTEDGKFVVKGVHILFETTGLPLDVMFETLKTKNIVPDWIEFYKEARLAGISHDRVISRLEEALIDVWNKSFSNIVVENLNKIFFKFR